MCRHISQAGIQTSATAWNLRMITKGHDPLVLNATHHRSRWSIRSSMAGGRCKGVAEQEEERWFRALSAQPTLFEGTADQERSIFDNQPVAGTFIGFAVNAAVRRHHQAISGLRCSRSPASRPRPTCSGRNEPGIVEAVAEVAVGTGSTLPLVLAR